MTKKTISVTEPPRLDVEIKHTHKGDKKNPDHELSLKCHDNFDTNGTPALIRWHSSKPFSIILPMKLTFKPRSGNLTSDPSLFNPNTTVMIDSVDSTDPIDKEVILQMTNYPTKGEDSYHIAVSNKVHTQKPGTKAEPYYYDVTEATLVWQVITVQRKSRKTK
jgi:hypothetical protein